MISLIKEPHFRCEECQRHFTQKIHLRKHVEKHHPEAVEYDFSTKDSGESLIKVEEISDVKGVIYEEYELVDETDAGLLEKQD